MNTISINIDSYVITYDHRTFGVLKPQTTLTQDQSIYPFVLHKNIQLEDVWVDKEKLCK